MQAQRLAREAGAGVSSFVVDPGEAVGVEDFPEGERAAFGVFALMRVALAVLGDRVLRVPMKDAGERPRARAFGDRTSEHARERAQTQTRKTHARDCRHALSHALSRVCTHTHTHTNTHTPNASKPWHTGCLAFHRAGGRPHTRFG